MLDITLAGTVGENLEPDGARGCWTSAPPFAKAGRKDGAPALAKTRENGDPRSGKVRRQAGRSATAMHEPVTHPSPSGKTERSLADSARVQGRRHPRQQDIYGKGLLNVIRHAALRHFVVQHLVQHIAIGVTGHENRN